MVLGFSGTGQVVQAESYKGHQSEQQEEQAGQEYYLSSWWYHDGAFVSSKDTLAQWAMALLGIIATGLSGWAVILLKRTLVQTAVATQTALRAVDVTESIGKAQTTAYLTISVRTLHMSKSTNPPWRPSISVGLSNSGFSTADEAEVVCDWRLIAGDDVLLVGRSVHPTYDGLITVAGNGGTENVDANLCNPPITDAMAEEVRGERAYWDVLVSITYSTIYGRAEAKARFFSHLIQPMQFDQALDANLGFIQRMRRVRTGDQEAQS